MEPTPEIIAALDGERIERARTMTIEERFLAAARLIDAAVSFMTAGIRMQSPDITDQQLQQQLGHRFELARQLENPQ